MAAAFARLPARVLWRLSHSEVPDEAALAELQLGNNTKVCLIVLISPESGIECSRCARRVQEARWQHCTLLVCFSLILLARHGKTCAGDEMVAPERRAGPQ